MSTLPIRGEQGRRDPRNSRPVQATAALVAAALASVVACDQLDVTVPGGDGGGVPSGEVAWVVAAAGAEHTCGLAATGTVFCWGANGRGQLGLGRPSGDAGTGSAACGDPCSPRPRAVVSPGVAFDTVVAGGYHTCGLTPRGRAFCWGANGRGQLGDSTRADASAPTPVSEGLSFRSLSAGASHTCGITRVHRLLFCWGDDFWGQLGRRGRSTAPVTGPRFILRDVRAVEAGARHTCAIVGPDRLLFCWGRNHRGQLGLGYVSDRPETVPTLVFVSVGSVSAGRLHTCARSRRSGTAICWGWNDEGAVGTGAETGFEPDPRRVAGRPEYGAVSAGGGHACGLLPGGGLECWGDDLRGQLGAGEFGGWRVSPSAVDSDRRFRSVTAGHGTTVEPPAAAADDLDGRRAAAHTCAVDGTGELLCWGANGHGQLGDGTLSRRTTPVRVTAPAGR